MEEVTVVMLNIKRFQETHGTKKLILVTYFAASFNE